MPRRVAPEDRVIRVSIGLPQKILDSLDEVLDEYNDLRKKTSEKEVNRSQFIANMIVESYGDASVVEFLKAQLGIAQIRMDFKTDKGKKGKK